MPPVRLTVAFRSTRPHCRTILSGGYGAGLAREGGCGYACSRGTLRSDVPRDTSANAALLTVTPSRTQRVITTLPWTWPSACKVVAERAGAIACFSASVMKHTRTMPESARTE